MGEERPVFAVERVSGAIEAGGSGVVELRVTNRDDEPVSDISAKLFTDDPMDSSDDEAFIDGLDPGESATIKFALSAGGEALEKPYPVNLDFQYDEADGDTLLSDTYTVSIEVTQPSGGGLPIGLLVGVVVVLAVVAGAVIVYRRRGGSSD